MADSILLKTCTACHVAKPLNEFKPERRGKYGRQGKCIPCQKEYKRNHARTRRQLPEVKERQRELRIAYRQTEEYKAYKRAYQNTDKQKEYARKRKQTEEYRQYSREYAKRYTEENKEKIKAELSTPEGKARRNRYRRTWYAKAKQQINAKKRKFYRRLVNGETQKGKLTRSDVENSQIVELYLSGLTTLEVASMTGLNMNGVNYRLKRAGVALRENAFGKFHTCNDGHVVRSGLERVVDDWLFANNIPHEVEPPCPWPPRTTKQSYADFKVGECYVEIWGLMQQESYRRKREYKIEQYKKSNAQLIELYPIDIYTMDFSCFDRFVSQQPIEREIPRLGP